MITLKKAIEIAIEKAGGGLAVDPDRIDEKPYGWIIYPNSKEYIETGNRMAILLGSGGILVLKESGEAIQFGSGFSLEKNIEIYESGYLDRDNWDIVITRVIDEDAGVSQLLALRATFIVPEEESGIVWKVPQDYSPERMKELIQELPFRLNIGSVYSIYSAVVGLEEHRHVDYLIEPNSGYVNSP